MNFTNCTIDHAKYLEEAEESFYTALDDKEDGPHFDIAQEILEDLQKLPDNDQHRKTYSEMETHLAIKRCEWEREYEIDRKADDYAKDESGVLAAHMEQQVY